MPSSGLVTSPRLPPPVQRNKHLPAAVLPAEGGVRVVAVLLDTLLELAARVVLYLRSEEDRGVKEAITDECMLTDCYSCCAVLGPLPRSAQRSMSVVAVKDFPGVRG